MTTSTPPPSEKLNFFASTEKHKPHVDPCFMTGKRCVYSESIERERNERHAGNRRAGFIIRPFEPNLRAFFDLCLKRSLENRYMERIQNEPDFKLEEADQVRKTGYIICEKICKKIQESDFVLADVSTPNPNVFYELGLALGMEQRVVIIYQRGSGIGRELTHYLGGAGCKTYSYNGLDDLELIEFKLSKYLWQHKPVPSTSAIYKPRIVLLETEDNQASPAGLKTALTKTPPRPVKNKSEPLTNDIHLDFYSHIQAAVTLAIKDIVGELKKETTVTRATKNIVGEPKKETIESDDYIRNIEYMMKNIEKTGKKSSFKAIASLIDTSYCTVIRTGWANQHDYMSYFWLGYSHAMGKNTIPIAIVNDPNDKVEDLAFDIRSLWYMRFAQEKPEKFHEEMKDMLKNMILTDFSQMYRKRFWREILGKQGNVSIFTGALSIDPPGRDMIGDWDLRAFSALTSAFASHHYQTTIESPVIQIEKYIDKSAEKGISESIARKNYRKLLKLELTDKNCIIIASSEVNPLTEIALGAVYNIREENWFTDNEAIGKHNYAVIGIKNQSIEQEGSQKKEFLENYTTKNTGRLFSTIRRIAGSEMQRGFEIKGGSQVLMDTFHSQTDEPKPFSSCAHLLIAKNPFIDKSDENKFLIILNGISGPATFALTQILTGGGTSAAAGDSTVSVEFVNKSEGFYPDKESEKILSNIIEKLGKIASSEITGLQYIFKIEIDQKQPEQVTEIDHIPATDWRRITEWKLVEDIGDDFELVDNKGTSKNWLRSWFDKPTTKITD